MKLGYQLAYQWALRCFGGQQVYNPAHRAMRTLEETIELAQVCGVPREKAMFLVEHVYNKPMGMFGQEVGGVMVTLAIQCAARGADPDFLFELELQRILSQPPEHFAARDRVKSDAGLQP